MKTAVIHETKFHRVTSHGNGIGYELRELTGSNERSVFVQGDDAWAFAKALGKAIRAYGEEDGLRQVWSDYEDVAN